MFENVTRDSSPLLDSAATLVLRPGAALETKRLFPFFFFLTQFPLSIGVDNLCDASLASSWIFVPESGGRPESVADTAEKQITSYI
jgi:hypothetical protein